MAAATSPRQRQYHGEFGRLIAETHNVQILCLRFRVPSMEGQPIAEKNLLVVFARREQVHIELIF